MVRIRLQRGGRRHVNYFRINAIEKRVKRDGAVLENLGWYNPQAKDKAKQGAARLLFHADGPGRVVTLFTCGTGR